MWNVITSVAVEPFEEVGDDNGLVRMNLTHSPLLP